jgi:hypothetical protein
MDTYRRTQVYLTPHDQRELRRVAAERGLSMTAVVREAVGRYLVDPAHHTAEPRWAEPDYEALGIPAGAGGLAARMRARSAAAPGPDAGRPALTPDDRDVGEHLYREYLRQRADLAARRAETDV